MFLAYFLATAALLIGASVASILTLALVPLSIAIQRGGRTVEQWQEYKVENPGGVKSINFLFGVLCTTFTRCIGFVAAAYVFHRFGAFLPLTFVLVGAAFFGINDVTRCVRFVGNSGFATEFGYLVGGIVGTLIGWSIGHSVFT